MVKISYRKYHIRGGKVTWKPARPLLLSCYLIQNMLFWMCAGGSRKTGGAFHYAKDSGNFGWNSNGKVRFGFF